MFTDNVSRASMNPVLITEVPQDLKDENIS